jgi:hypothetical protein
MGLHVLATTTPVNSRKGKETMPHLHYNFAIYSPDWLI